MQQRAKVLITQMAAKIAKVQTCLKQCCLADFLISNQESQLNNIASKMFGLYWLISFQQKHLNE